MALDTWRVDMAVRDVDPLMAFMERKVIHTCIARVNVANGCFGSRSDLGHRPSHMASASQKNPGKSRLAILWFARSLTRELLRGGKQGFSMLGWMVDKPYLTGKMGC